MVTVISLGGSIVAPDKPDTDFLKNFSNNIRKWLSKDNNRKLIFVVGGGGPARSYQNAYKTLVSNPSDEEADWIGIMATRLNAQLLKAIFSDLCFSEVIYNPTKAKEFEGKILVAAGWKPGFSTDNDAVYLAEKFNAKTVINLSNIAKVYTDDPKTNPNAKPIDKINWANFRKLVGSEWTPGKNVPFDPVASKNAEKLGLKVICAAGRDLENLTAILENKDFVGTTIN